MEKPIERSVLGVYFDLVPSSSDPPRASTFYYWVGLATVAWGRLEGNYNHIFLTVLNVANSDVVGNRFYIQRDKSTEIWRTAFETCPELTQHATIALQFSDKMTELADFRDLLVHGQWGEFTSGQLAMKISKIKQMPKGPRDVIQHNRGVIYLDSLRQFVLETNLLNKTLSSIADILIPLRGAIPPNAHRP